MCICLCFFDMSAPWVSFLMCPLLRNIDFFLKTKSCIRIYHKKSISVSKFADTDLGQYWESWESQNFHRQTFESLKSLESLKIYADRPLRVLRVLRVSKFTQTYLPTTRMILLSVHMILLSFPVHKVSGSGTSLWIFLCIFLMSWECIVPNTNTIVR